MRVTAGYGNSSWCSSQRNQVFHQIGYFLRAVLVLQRWHLRFRKTGLAQVLFHERTQSRVAVEQLHTECVVVEQPSRDAFSLAGDHCVSTAVGLNLLLRLQQ